MTASATLESTAPPEHVRVLVVGAGLAGLSCARHLLAGGVEVHLVEASDAVGGRVRTDEVEGFRLDRGFQVLLTAYDAVWELVDREELDVHPFQPGSLVYREGRLHELGDPFRRPSAALASVRAPVGSLGDKLRVAGLRRTLLSSPPAEAFEGPRRTTLEELRGHGFSEDFIDGFFRPFLGGVFLDRELAAPAALFRYYFRCFAAGDAVLPRGGMQRLPELMAAPLSGRLSLNTRVRAVRPDGVTLDDGVTVSADQVVLATDGVTTAHLLGEAQAPTFKGTVTAWFTAPEDPVGRPILVLDGEGEGPVNHLAVNSAVTASVAPPGSSLIAASGVNEVADDPESFAAGARRQLERWFGRDSVAGWRHLHTHHVPRALPRQTPEEVANPAPAIRPDGIAVAGDTRDYGAIQGAILSGRRVAAAVRDRLA